MSVSSLKTLRELLKRRSFDGVYYVSGEDDYQKEDAIRQIVSAAVEPASRDFNLDIRKAGDLDPEGLSVLLGTPPMMAERRVIVIREATGLKKDSRRVLDDYLKNPAQDVVVILTSPAGSKSDSALASGSIVLQFDPLSGDRIPKWIAHHARSELGVEISEGAVELLQAAVGSDLYQLAAELDKLASFIQGNRGEIVEDDVAAIVGVRRGETQADLLDAVAEKNASRALELVPHILSQPKTTAVSVVMALSTQMLAMAWGKSRIEEGVSRSKLSQEYFDLLRETGSFTGRSWGSATATWSRTVDRWSSTALVHAIEFLVEADIALKESKVSSEEQLLATVILSLCAAEEKHAAA